MRIDVLEDELERLDREGRVPKFIYTVPSFQNPAGVTLSLERRRELVRIAHERELLVLEDNPYGLLRYEGEPLPTLYLARRRRVRDLPRHVLEDPLARPAAGLGGRPAAGARQAQPRQGRRRPVLVDAVAAVRRHLLRRARLARLPAVRWSSSTGRRRDVDARRARRALPARGDVDATRRRPVHLGAAARATSTPPTCSRARCARTWRSCPGARPTSTAAAASEMRLNFSGVSEDDIREGIRRIGKVVREQVGAVLDADRRKPRRRRAGADEPRTWSSCGGGRG